MRRSLLALVSVVALLVALPHALAFGATKKPFDPPGSLTTTTEFADPGFSRIDGRYYLYRTGEGFHVMVSTESATGYTKPKRAMSQRPAWVGSAGAMGHRLWAPHVFRSSSTRQYVMYFSGWHAKLKRNCIGVATSSRPDGGFVPQPVAAICSARAGVESIDPVSYPTRNGQRLLLYKSSRGNVKDWAIKMVRFDRAGTTRLTKDPMILLQTRKTLMESPSLVRRGSTFWLFTSGGKWANCTYHTDAWSATGLRPQSFGHRRTILSSAGRPGYPCGPGGAEALPDGSSLAYHVWVGGTYLTAKPGKRVTYVAPLRWGRTGAPYVGR